MNNVKENKLTLEEAKLKKEELEKAIVTIIRNFEIDTKCVIKHINLDSYRVFADGVYISRTHQVEVECHL